MKVTAGWVEVKLARPLEGQRRVIRRSQIRRAAQKPRHVLGHRVEHFAGTGPRRHALCVRRKAGNVGVPTGGQLTRLHCVPLGCQSGMRRAILGQLTIPRGMGLAA
jgi:hypothetical protein